MPDLKSHHLDEHLRVRLADLDPSGFERFFLHFLRSGISLSAERHGRKIVGTIINAELYAAGTGRNQKGIDIRAEVEVDARKEIWVFQCKRHKSWDTGRTRKAVEKATQYPAQHYFLVVTCDPHEDVQDEIHKHANWTFWNLDTICAELRLRVPPAELPSVLFFLSSAELRRFAPYTTEALVTPAKFFSPFLGPEKLFRHDWKLVARQKVLESLSAFLSGKKRVQVLCAKGGEGKSRLLWEFCQVLAAEKSIIEVLCLNPYRQDEDFSLAFVGKPASRVILVDDAHRTERIPMSLLSIVRDNPKAKIIFATRPQGFESLQHKLGEAGLLDELAPLLTLQSLTRSEIRSLAAEALGESTHPELVNQLAELTFESPFLTVIAGDLIRRGQLKLGNWTSNETFRREVFREFEVRTLEAIPEEDRKFAAGIIRLIALIAPGQIDPEFPDKAARCLGISSFEFETELNRLRQSELVAGEEESLRIVPDLFADFLVYETCYGTTKQSAFVRNIIEQFGDRSAALVRNLSEAAWVARVNGVTDDALIGSIFDLELRRFDMAGFSERLGMLHHWSGFSVFLPGESLALAKRALGLADAPVPTLHENAGRGANFFTDSSREAIRPLLQPIAIWHDQYRDMALDLLWLAGLGQPWTGIEQNKSHPWAAIAEIIKFEPKKSVSVTLDTLDWLFLKVRSPEVLDALEKSTPILRAFVSHCFNRVVEFTWWEGRTCHFCRQAVSIDKTRPIREKAVRLLGWVIEHGSSLAAADALSALATGIDRITRFDLIGDENEEKVRADWRPERLRALQLFEQALVTQSSVAVRFQILRTLKREIAYEEDPEFKKDCHAVVGKVPGDLALRTAAILLSASAWEFWEEEGLFDPNEDRAERKDKANQWWQQRVRQTAKELATSYPEAGELVRFLDSLAIELTTAGYHLYFGPLFTEVAQVAPALAAELARMLLEGDDDRYLVCEWPALVEQNSSLERVKISGLYEKASVNTASNAAKAVVRLMVSRTVSNTPIHDAERQMLIRIATMAQLDVMRELLRLVQWSHDENLPWAYKVLEALPVKTFAKELIGECLQALVPYNERKLPLPRTILQKALSQFLSVPDLAFFQHTREWDFLTKNYPREVYELLRARVERAASAECREIIPVPLVYRRSIDLSELAREPDYALICDDLWRKVSNRHGPAASDWLRLFQIVVFEDYSAWPSRLIEAIKKAETQEDLYWFLAYLRFEGSLIIFRFPAVTRAYLRQAQRIAGDPFCHEIRLKLYSGCGPQSRAYSNGVLDKEFDYVEAEAVKAAEHHASDELLGPFYRWIVEVEQKQRIMHKKQQELLMACD